MGRFFYLTRKPRSPQPARPPRLTGRRQRRTWCVATVLAIAVASVGYVVQSNSLATKGYHIEQLRETVQHLRLESRDLERQVLELESYEHLTQRISQLMLVPAESVQYLAEVSPVARQR